MWRQKSQRFIYRGEGDEEDYDDDQMQMLFSGGSPASTRAPLPAKSLPHLSSYPLAEEDDENDVDSNANAQTFSADVVDDDDDDDDESGDNSQQDAEGNAEYEGDDNTRSTASAPAQPGKATGIPDPSDVDLDEPFGASLDGDPRAQVLLRTKSEMKGSEKDRRLSGRSMLRSGVEKAVVPLEVAYPNGANAENAWKTRGGDRAKGKQGEKKTSKKWPFSRRSASDRKPKDASPVREPRKRTQFLLPHIPPPPTHVPKAFHLPHITPPPNPVTKARSFLSSSSGGHEDTRQSSNATHSADSLGSGNHSNHGSSSQKSTHHRMRIKPYHLYPADHPFLTEQELYREMTRPSEAFVHLTSAMFSSKSKAAVLSPENSPVLMSAVERMWGSNTDGRIGSLKVEVLGCVGLPRFDRFYKPNTFVNLVCGDAAFATDTITSSNSPMWPARSRRAACFPIFHAYARLYVGVFSAETSKKENDDFVGRVVIDLAVLRPNSEYDITLPLRASSFVYDRRPRGVVRLRFSLHWYSERAAVLSYLRAPKATDLHGNDGPTVCCANAKTFRNVALTLHGQDLPGKFTKRAFRATTREASLYQVQLKYMLKTLLFEAVLYDRPMFSLYLFAGWMYCVFHNSVRMVPPWIVGYFVLHHCCAYASYTMGAAAHNGYPSLTVREVADALFWGSTARCHNGTDRPTMEPLLARKRPIVARSPSFGEDKGDEQPAETPDSLEFPFSEPCAYKKMNIQESLVRTGFKASHYHEMKLSNTTLGRLSVYQLDTGGASSDEDNGNVHASDHPEDESISSDDDSSIDSEMDDTFVGRESTRGHGSAPKIPIGPQQDVDVLPPRGVPFKARLRKIERLMHKMTLWMFEDPIFVSAGLPDEDDGTDDLLADGEVKKKKKKTKVLRDEFDRRLGYYKSSSNPLTQLQASYLGPVMNMVRLGLSIVRAIFNVASWKDPYLSFWVLVFSCALMLILIVFPWRPFFFTVGLVALGPQNLCVKLMIFRNEKPAALSSTPEQKESKEDPKKESESSAKPSLKESTHKRKFLPRFRKRTGNTHESKEETKVAEVVHERPAFHGQQIPVLRSSKKPVTPRDVVVPYGRIKKERFYDWPPDPTISRARPLLVEETTHCGAQAGEKIIDWGDIDPNKESLKRRKSFGSRRETSLSG